MDICLWT